uniref:PCNA-interacting partner n=1 Tax=Leptobrachium leishanense TaxID=445787 RepID=A0A8C5WDL6_9ANUR
MKEFPTLFWKPRISLVLATGFYEIFRLSMTRHQEGVLNLIIYFRRHCCLLAECERTTVCGADNMLLVLQLAMAEVNKKNGSEFTVSLSDVLLVWKHLLRDKLGLVGEPEEVPENYSAIKEMYSLFLKNSNTLDLIDLHEKCLLLHDYKEANSLSSHQLLEFISGRLPDSEGPKSPINPVSTPSRNNLDALKVKETLKRIFCAYLNLLVNSKNDFALAQVLNCPERELGREAFTDLKRKSSRDQMSLFLVATSFIRTLDLGGKGYAPPENDPLRKHTKGLSHFVHFIDRLNEILGENQNPRAAGGMLLSSIKMHLIKGKGSGDPISEAATDVAQDLDLRLKKFINFSYEDGNGSTTGISPARPRIHAINRGTASGGRETVKMLLALLDEEAANPPSRNKAELLCSDEDSPLFGALSLVTLFRSPEQGNGLSPKQLSQRVKKCIEQKKPKLKQNLIKSQFACTYKDGNQVQTRQTAFPSMSQVPSCAHPGPKIVQVLCFDEEPEGICVEKRGLQPVSGNVKIGVAGATRKVKSSKSTKRKQADMDSENLNEQEPPVKKTICRQATTKPASKASSKAAPKNKLIAGQAKLTTFFRL